MDKRTSEQIGLYRGFNNSYGVGTLYRYSISIRIRICKCICGGCLRVHARVSYIFFVSPKKGVAHRGWDGCGSGSELLVAPL